MLDELKPNSIDLVVTSPPYDNLRHYEDSCESSYSIFKKVANKLYTVMKEGGVIVWIVGDAVVDYSETGSSFKQALYFKKIGFILHDTMIWEKPLVLFSNKNRYQNCFEYMFVFSKDGQPKTANIIRDRKNKSAGKEFSWCHRGEGQDYLQVKKDVKKTFADYGIRHNIWKISQILGNEHTGHPAQFPLQLAKDHIISWSNKNDIVLDPFMGSGTVGEACMQLQRRFIGIELVDKYFDIAYKRVKKANNSLINLSWMKE